MAPRASFAALVAAALSGGCAPSAFRADAGAVFLSVQGEIGLQNSGGTLILENNLNDIEADLGLDAESVSPYLRLESDWSRHRVKVSGFMHQSDGQGTLSGDFGNIPSGTAVTTEFDLGNVSGSYAFDLLPAEGARLAVGIQLGYYRIGLDTRSVTPTAFEQLDADVFAPMPYLEVEFDLGDMVRVGANGGAVAIDIGDIDGIYVDAEAYARIEPVRGFELIGGYRYLRIDADGVADGRDFVSDLEISGWFVGGGVCF